MSSEFDDLPAESLVARDYAAQQASSDVTKMLEQVAAQGERSMRRIRVQLIQSFAWPGRISPADYVTYRLFEKSKSERKEFISDWVHWPIEKACGDEELSPVTVDKWRCIRKLQEAGIPTAPVVAVIDSDEANYGEVPTISTSADLVAVFEHLGKPLFAKPKNLLGSFGAFRIDNVDDEFLTYNGSHRFETDRVVDVLMGGIPYVLQPVLDNHEQIHAVASGLATVRIVNMVYPDGVRIAAAAFKIPIGNNVADNFWRSGNLVADVDPKTGTLRRVVQGAGLDQVECPNHPETGLELAGMKLPLWNEAVDLNNRTAELFSSIRYQSLDIALTPKGPVIIEVNSGSSFSLPQIASGCGFLTSENKQFFESCGVKFRRLTGPLDQVGLA